MTSRGFVASLIASLALFACSENSPSSAPECGDGAATGTEQCDDGNTTDGDGCSASCRDETDGSCGDGVIEGDEACDDMNATADDGCTECAVDAGYTCTGAPSVCTMGGDPLADGSCEMPFEVVLADDGAGAMAGNAIGDTTGGSSHVPVATCNGEDLGGGNDLVYSFTLTDTSDVDILGPDPYAFDMFIRLSSTACDLGTQVPDKFSDGCDNFDPESLFYTALPAGTYYLHVDGVDDQEAGAFDVGIFAYPTTCGDGFLDIFEDCDDSGLAPSDGCSATCTVEEGYECDDGEPSVCVVSTCGNGVLDMDEECDDDDMLDGNGCDSSCEIESGWSCTGAPSVCIESCGNNAIEVGEECDDGDDVGGNGCNDICQVEPGWDCTGTPSVCVQTCNDGTFDYATEECDDDNALDGDGCSATCSLEAELFETGANDAAPVQALTYTFDNGLAIVRMKGTFSSETDVDLYSFTLDRPAYVFLETYNAIDTDPLNYAGEGWVDYGDCYFSDTTLRLYNSGDDYSMDTPLVAFDDDDGDEACSFIGEFDAGGNTNEGLLQPGTYVVKLNNDQADLYVLDLTIFATDAPAVGDLVINEVMANPNTVADTNCDGSSDSAEDEFIEIINTSTDFLDLTGVTIEDVATNDDNDVRHEFLAAGGPTGLLPGESIVVWSGGAPACVGVDNWFVSSEGALQINNDNEQLWLYAPGNATPLSTTGVLGSTSNGVSFNLDADVIGTTYVEHDTLDGTRDYSPGTRVDGSAFVP